METRTWSPARSSVPISTTSTPISAASALISGVPSAKRAATAVLRTVSVSEGAERAGDRLGKPRRQEVDLGIGPEDLEGQNDESGDGTHLARGSGVDQAQRVPDGLGHSPDVLPAVPRALGESALDHPVRRDHVRLARRAAEAAR